MNSSSDARMNGPATAVEPSGNGPALIDRVRALRMPGRADIRPGGGGGSLVPWVLCLLLAACSLSLAVRYYAHPPAARDDAPAADAKADPAGATPVSGSGLALTRPSKRGGPVGTVVHEGKGYIIPVRQTPVSPIEVSGRLVELHFREGDKVKAGDLLAVLEKTRYQADADEARAIMEQSEQRFWELANGSRPEEIESAEAELAEAQATLVQARKDYERNRGITGSALAAKEREQAESTYRAAENRERRLQSSLALMIQGPRKERINAAWAEVKQNRARLERAEWLLGNCTIRAPVSGTILTKPVEVGGFVNSLANNSAFASGLCDLADLTDLEVDLTIQEREIARVWVGMPCKVRSETYDRDYNGVLSREMPNADQAKGAINVRVKITDDLSQEQGKYLKPKTGVVVTFIQPAEKTEAKASQ